LVAGKACRDYKCWPRREVSNIPTLDFSKAKYRSDYVDFIGRETADRNFEPQQELYEKDYEIIDAFNPDMLSPFF